MTEDEAKTKWCPQMMMIGGFVGVAVQLGAKPLKNPLDLHCIGSKCMMWRWSISEHQAAEINARGNAGAVASGHCGLAGKP